MKEQGKILHMKVPFTQRRMTALAGIIDGLQEAIREAQDEVLEHFHIHEQDQANESGPLIITQKPPTWAKKKSVTVFHGAGHIANVEINDDSPQGDAAGREDTCRADTSSLGADAANYASSTKEESQVALDTAADRVLDLSASALPAARNPLSGSTATIDGHPETSSSSGQLRQSASLPALPASPSVPWVALPGWQAQQSPLHSRRSQQPPPAMVSTMPSTARDTRSIDRPPAARSTTRIVVSGSSSPALHARSVKVVPPSSSLASTASRHMPGKPEHTIRRISGAVSPRVRAVGSGVIRAANLGVIRSVSPSITISSTPQIAATMPRPGVAVRTSPQVSLLTTTVQPPP
mmetsp:Transcript_116682/g.371205  ORF Transcript_116682/g.371205 Transcript_116682/m.371205 type:complete len:350 (-) Transcript_116682:13-1062(-)